MPPRLDRLLHPRELLQLTATRARAVVTAALRVARTGVPLEVQAEPQIWGMSWRPMPTSGIAKTLTPARVSTILQAAEEGQPGQMCELLEEIEDRDLHLVSVLSTRKRAPTTLDWEICPVDDRRSSRKVAEFCKGRIDAIDNFEDGLIDLLDAVSKGFAMVELDWYSRGGESGIRSMDYRPQRWFVPDIDRPTEWRLLDVADPVRGVELQPWRWAIHTSRAKSGFPVKAGLGRVLVWWYLFKNYAVKDWVSYAELFGAPLRVGKYASGTSPTDIQALRDAVDRLGVDASAVIPQETVIEFIGDKNPRTGGDVYAGLIELCDRGMSKAVLGQTLTTEEGRSGSRALGTVHNEVRHDLVVSDANQLARTLTRSILAPLVLFNFGPEVPVPRFRFETEEDADEKVEAETREVRARVFKAAAALGVPVPLAQVQVELGIRLPEGNEPLLAVPAPDTDTDTDIAAETPTRELAVNRVHLLGCGYDHAALADREAIPSLLRPVEDAVLRYQAGPGAEAWEDLVRAIRERLGRARSLEEVPNAFLDILRRFDLQPLAAALADATMTADLIGRVQAESGDQVPDDGFPRLPPIEAAAYWAEKRIVTPAEFRRMDEAHRSRAFTASRFTTTAALGETHQLLQDVIRNGKTFADFEDAMDRVFSRAGLQPSAPWRLETVFRTNVFTAYSVGRDTQQRTERQLRLRPYWRYNTMDDSRARPAHANMDGKVYPAEHAIWDVWTPPNGYGCRCWRSAHSQTEVAANGWIVHTTPPDDIAAGGPLLPDPGFRRDPSKDPFTYDWSRFPPEWREALGVEAA